MQRTRADGRSPLSCWAENPTGRYRRPPPHLSGRSGPARGPAERGEGSAAAEPRHLRGPRPASSRARSSPSGVLVPPSPRGFPRFPSLFLSLPAPAAPRCEAHGVTGSKQVCRRLAGAGPRSDSRLGARRCGTAPGHNAWLQGSMRRAGCTPSEPFETLPPVSDPLDTSGIFLLLFARLSDIDLPLGINRAEVFRGDLFIPFPGVGMERSVLAVL